MHKSKKPLLLWMVVIASWVILSLLFQDKIIYSWRFVFEHQGTPANAGVGRNDYSDLAQQYAPATQENNLNRSVAAAVQTNPDEMARAMRLARATGIDPQGLVGNPTMTAQAQQQARRASIDGYALLRQNPAVAAGDSIIAKFMSDPINARDSLYKFIIITVLPVVFLFIGWLSWVGFRRTTAHLKLYQLAEKEFSKMAFNLFQRAIAVLAGTAILSIQLYDLSRQGVHGMGWIIAFAVSAALFVAAFHGIERKSEK